ncbi:MAG: glycosyltransferase, partial [Candidatus Omnitrophica bacterium]|nr:glycosyltransferase [Candidatus Omnitrophota bacterium]
MKNQIENYKCDVIIPVCNMLAYTKLCLEKLLENTLIPFDLIIIDNGSTDGTERFFSSFNPSKVNLKYIRNEENIGPILAYNQGIKRGDSSYVCMMHNDVLIFQKGWLGKILNIMGSNKDIGIVGLAGRKRINKKGLVDESSLVHNLQNEHLNSPMKSDIENVAV